MELVKLLKGGDKTCYKHSYLRTVGKTFHIFFFFIYIIPVLVKVWVRIFSVTGVLGWL